MDKTNRFSIAVIIKHPNIDPAEITKALSLTPSVALKAGDTRLTPRGTVLAGVHKGTTWSYVADHETKSGFSDAISDLASKLVLQLPFFERLSKEGGRSEICLRLPGEGHQGDALNPELLAKIARLGCHLGVEVFP